MTNILQKTDKDLRRFFESPYATLQADGTIPDEQVPGQVTDVLNYETKNDFPAVGDPDKYYRSDASGKTYKWDAEASEYVEVVIPVVAVTSVAGRAGDVVLAKADVGLGNVANTGDSATPIANGTTKFTTGGAYTELAKKADKPVVAVPGDGLPVPSGAFTGVKRIAFNATAFGMPADAMLKSITLVFTSGQAPVPGEASRYAKIVDPSTSTVLGTSDQIAAPQKGQSMKIDFSTPVRLPGPTTKEYYLNFYDSATADVSSLGMSGINLCKTDQTDTDFYVKQSGADVEKPGWRPKLDAAEWTYDLQTLATAVFVS